MAVKQRTSILVASGLLLMLCSLLALYAVKYHFSHTHYWQPLPWWATHELRAAYVCALFAAGPLTLLFALFDMLMYTTRAARTERHTHTPQRP